MGKYMPVYQSFKRDLPKQPWWKFWKWGENPYENRVIGRVKIEELTPKERTAKR